MTATDELRRLLDERGVEYCTSGYRQTWWEFGTGGHAFAVQDGPTVCVALTGADPEQAVEATLGRGTCKPIISDNLTESEGTGDAWAYCSECGHLLFVLTDPNSEPLNYCPNCGKRVDNG